MKRSKMVKLLAEQLQIISGLSGEADLPMETCINDASCLLEKLQEAGMRPPGWSIPGKVYYMGDTETTWEKE